MGLAIPTVAEGSALDAAMRLGLRAAAALGFTVYVAVATVATLVFPLSVVLFFAPLGVALVLYAPRLSAAPKRIVMPLLYVCAALLPLWPIYLHLKIGPAPILTPPRLVFYVLTALWLYDMLVSPLRRGQLLSAIRRGAWIAGPVFALWFLGFASLPFAEGRSIALAEFIRQTTIWFIPFLVTATYVRRAREFRLVIVLITGAAAISGAIALLELASGQLLATVLSPFISDSGDWLLTAQSQKIRDGVFRAQAGHTHPLSLGEFLALAAPLAFALAISARSIAARVQWLFALALISAGAYATGSRAALLAIAIAMSFAATIFAIRFLRRAVAWRFRPAAGLALAVALLASPAVAVVSYEIVAGKMGASAASSSQDRIIQIEKALPKIMARPIGGYGAGRAARVLGHWGSALTIDNYYLTLALDYGLPGPIALAALFIGMGAFALRRSGAAPPDVAAIYVGLSAAAAALALTRIILSQTGNLSFLFVLLGALAGARLVRGAAGRRSARRAGGSRPPATRAWSDDGAPRSGAYL